MKSYIFSVIATAVLVPLVGAISPEGKGGGIKKSVSFIMALVFLAVGSGPLVSLVGALKDYNSELIAAQIGGNGEGGRYEEIFRQTVGAVAEKEVGREVSRILVEDFDISEDEQSVKVGISDESELLGIEIELFSGALLKNPRKIEERIEALFGTECTVYEKWGEKNG